MDIGLNAAAPRLVAAPRASTARRTLFIVAIAACVPYVVLKTVWLAGGTVGIPPGSVLRGDDSGLAAVNALTVVMDLTVIAVALALTRPWGRRLPAWVVAVPMWIATGLIGPIFIAYPLQLLARLLGGHVSAAAQAHPVPFLDAWVYAVVYSGFMVQGLALGGLFTLYAHDRWGRLLRGRIADLPADSPTGPARRTVAVAAAVLALLPAVMHIAWAAGSTAGLTAARAANRGTDFYLVEATYALFVVAAVAGALMPAFRIRPHGRLAVPLALGWCGAGTTATWGGWMLLAELPGDQRNPLTQQAAALMNLTYAVQMTAGILIVAFGAFVLAESAAAGACREA